ncbi:MAG: hypothetical protein Q7U04_11360, partial [Bacteriovorax sp.]|nr:hypothetical protein [Bacteriovorax sp.]
MNISCYIIPANYKNVSFNLKNIHQEIYKCWKDEWSNTWSEITGQKKIIYSCELSRQDTLLALFNDEKCIALCSFRQFEQNDISAFDDSYFSFWPKSASEQLMGLGQKVLICGQLTVAKEYRRKESDVSLRDILSGIATKYFLDSDSNIMIGTTRVSKGMDRVCYGLGATPILQNLPYIGKENVDLVVFHKHSVEAELPL